ncbi:preprotein translocase subunit YajC [Butyrivibrio sp. MC2013]|uniref:preprotein translocase subunit YajC n=1 Tax=Butyrivibrio sp. MC2013 TaxID=1280686 RepID=UPI0004098653|nr:preprotein translocase subunit YajC [Butyrivibrio sp. MC2013]
MLFYNGAMALDAAASTAAGYSSILMIVVMLGAMYFLILRPQRKQEKEKTQMMASLEMGDTVRTTGGFIGTIIDIRDDKVIIEFGNNKNCRIPMVKEAIVEVEKPQDAVKPESSKK